VLAARGENPGQVALTMLAFGIGAGLPLILLGMLSREALLRWRNRLLSAGSRGKTILGVILLTAGLLVLTGLEKRVEAMLVEASPEWLTDLTTRY
jgi:cytochrome c-type biogenesis protein